MIKEGPNDYVIRDLMALLRNDMCFRIKSDHICVKIDVSRNNTSDETLQGANFSKNDLGEPPSRISKESVSAGSMV